MQGIALDDEPVYIRGSRAVLQDVIELEKASAGVVEHSVQDDADTSGMGGVQKLAESCVPAQEGIYPIVIVGVIAVVGRGLEDRVEVDGGDAQVHQVVQMFGHPQ